METNILALPKTGLKSSLVQALYNEIVANTSAYYYFLGKTLTWDPVGDLPSIPEDTQTYEADTRERMIFMKKITAADVSLTIPRYDWLEGEVFDMYDDQLGRVFNVTPDPIGANNLYLYGSFDLSKYGVGWLVEGDGIAEETFITALSEDRITLSKRTIGDVNSINIINVASSGARTLENARFYVLTNDRNVYKCLSNNKGKPSTIKPYSTSEEPIVTSDGYKWKFMYTIPGSMYNKFTSLDDIPVTTAVKSSFFSRGSINSVTINDYGSGYQQGDILVVTGDGHLVDNPLKITSVEIESVGSGYSIPPTVTVTDPFDAFDFEPNTQYLTGQYIKAGNRIYEVRQGGTSGLEEPTHTSTTSVINGTGNLSLRFVGISVTGTAVLSSSSVDSVLLDGVIGYIDVTDVGSGYDTAPNVTIVGDGTGAQAVAYVNSGRVTKIEVTARGTGYSTATVSIDAPGVGGVQAAASIEIYYGYGYNFSPTVSFSPPFEHDFVWGDQTTAELNDIIKVDRRFYEVTSVEGSGLLGSITPDHFSGTVESGECEITFIGDTASGVVIAEKTKAKITPIIEGGQIVNVAIQDPGIGYNVAEINAFGAGAGAIIVPNLSVGDLTTRQANVELLAIRGSIDHIDVLSPGLNYSSATTVIVHGDGSGCTAVPVVEQGVIKRIDVITPGANYTKATIEIIGNENATPAYARAIISPFDGHGANAIAELFARDMALATTIARDRNLGFIVENDYRQLGIIRNPRSFDLTKSTQRYNRLSGSTCLVVTGDFSYPDLQNDMELVDENGFRYNLVAKSLTEPDPGQPTSILIQSLDNKIPSLNSLMSYQGNSVPLTATISNVVLPDIDKYSGDILFIDNRASFQPTEEQTLAIKTVIRL